jgi:trigger factor
MNQETSATTVAAVNALERRIDMAVSMADIDKDVAQRLKAISRTVKMPGFRPGKVPMKMVEQQYGSQTRSEALGAAVEKAFGEKVREQQLRVAGYPRIEPKEGGGSAAELQFSAVFEVYPEVVLGDVSGREIERATLVVGDAEVDKTIEVLRQQRTTYSPANRPAVSGDRLSIDFTGRKGGEIFQGGEAKDYALMLGGGAMLPDFEAALIGMTADASKTFDLTFPADYHATDLAGQTVQFEVVVKSVDMPQVPELDAEFAKSLGVTDGDLVKMRAEVQANLEREVKKRLQARIKGQVMEALLQVTPIEVPKALIDMESRDMAEKARRDFESRGMATQNVPVQPSWFIEPATRRVKLGLILSELVKSQGLAAKPAQVRGIVDDFSETFEDPTEVVRWYYSQPQRLAEAEALAVENNVVEWALANAKAIDKPVSFDDLMGNAA